MRLERPPVGQVAGKKEDVASMFDAIAPRYDLLNRVLSLGIDRLWRRRVVGKLKNDHPKRILDVATGTGDLAIALQRISPDEVVGVDISEEMLRMGRQKLKKRRLEHKIVLENGDSEGLPFTEHSFDAVTVAFGVRNFEDLQRGLLEMNRVLVPGGKLVVLEFSRPRHFPIKQIFDLYFKRILPGIGRRVSGVSGPYSYLPESVQVFPDGEDFLNEMREAEFTEVSQDVQTFGIATIYSGRKSAG